MYAFSGVRPSSGAASSASCNALEILCPAGGWPVSAPADGRTPLNAYEAGQHTHRASNRFNGLPDAVTITAWFAKRLHCDTAGKPPHSTRWRDLDPLACSVAKRMECASLLALSSNRRHIWRSTINREPFLHRFAPSFAISKDGFVGYQRLAISERRSRNQIG